MIAAASASPRPDAAKELVDLRHAAGQHGVDREDLVARTLETDQAVHLRETIGGEGFLHVASAIAPDACERLRRAIDATLGAKDGADPEAGWYEIFQSPTYPELA